jgi:hypothetical protein
VFHHNFTFHIMLVLYGDPQPNPLNGGWLLAGRLWLLIHHIHSTSPYMGAVSSDSDLKTRHRIYERNKLKILYWFTVNDASKHLTCLTTYGRMIVNNLKGCTKKLPWPVLRQYPRTCLKVLTALKYICQDRRLQAQESNLDLPNTASIKMIALWDIAPCSLVEVYRRFRDAYCLHNQGDLMMKAVDRRFRGAYCLHHQGDLMMDAVCITETSV